MEKNIESIVQGFIQNIGEKSIEQVLKGNEFISLFDENQKENVLMDFSSIFKKKNTGRVIKRPSFMKENNPDLSNQQTQDQQDDQEKEDFVDNFKDLGIKKEVVKIQNEIPRNLTISQEEMNKRRFLDQRRWFCLSRAQYKRSCGISSLISVWNYLFSWLGTGSFPPLSQEEALIKLGVCKEFDREFKDIEFGAFTGNMTLIKWFRQLCKLYGVEGRAFMMWKLHGQGKTAGIDEELALQKLEDGLKTENNAFIYHAYDHYFCPMGFEITPNRPQDAYKTLDELKPNEVEHWIFIGEPSKCYPVFHIRKWKDVAMDINLQYPQFYNIRQPQKGIQEKKNPKGKKGGGTLHCILQFQKVVRKEKGSVQNSNNITIEQDETIMEEFDQNQEEAEEGFFDEN